MRTEGLRCDRCGAVLAVASGPVVRCDECGASLRVDLLRALSTPLRGSELRAPVVHSLVTSSLDPSVPARRVVRGVLSGAAVWTLASAITIADPFEWRLNMSGAPTAGVVAPGDAPIHQTFTGTTDGEHEATSFASRCRGHVPSRPTLLLRLRETTAVTLRTASSDDLVMVTRDESGNVRCDDDSGGGNAPMISAVLPAGVVRVWVGAFSEDASPRYSLELRAQTIRDATPLANGLAIAAPSVASIDLDETPSGESAPFAVDGSVAARAVNSSCSGFVTLTPSFELVTRAPRRVVVTTSGSADLVAVARVGEAWSCNDDGAPPNPRLELDLPAGRHHVWIGRYQTTLNATTHLTWTSGGDER